MRFHWYTLLFIALVGLTACGGTPEQVKLDRRYLDEAQLQEQLAKIKAEIAGVVLDELIWISGEDKVFTLLTREQDAEHFGGIFLRHYKVGEQTPELLWTYQDSINCAGAAAGANLVKNQSPELRPAAWAADGQDQFLLRYELGCTQQESKVGENKTLVVIDARSGTPEVRLEAGLATDIALGKLPTAKASKLQALWEATVW